MPPHRRQRQQDADGQAAHGIRGEHERDGTDDSIRELRDSVMARTYRDVAIEDMLRTVEEAMSRVIDWWGDLPVPMKEAVEQFRTQLGAAIDSVEFVRRALDGEVPETDYGEGPP